MGTTAHPGRPVSTPVAGAAASPARDQAGRPKRRLDHIDAMRPVKQVGVVSTHTLLAFAPLLTYLAGGTLLLLHVTREAFLFVSACMLTYSYQGIGRGRYRIFYRKRAVSVLAPYVCWTIIYFVLTYPGHGYGTWTGLGHLGYLLATGYFQLYYLVVIMQFYLLFPLALALLRRLSGRHVQLLVASGLVQVVYVSLMHWGALPAEMQGFWATREIFSYQFYLVAGMVVALHLDWFHGWLCRHVRAVLIFTLVAAVVAEAWFGAAAHHLAGWLGDPVDPFLPVVIPFNIGAIAAIYLVGVYLVDPRRSPRLQAVVRSGSDNAYGIYLAQMVFILGLGWVGWRSLPSNLPWPLVSAVTVPLVVGACVLTTSILARTPLAVALTGRRRADWASWWPQVGRAREAGQASDGGVLTAPVAAASVVAAPVAAASVVGGSRPTVDHGGPSRLNAGPRAATTASAMTQ
jgi:peptidoglycan/LPS O-acetylase OafA/YrhL